MSFTLNLDPLGAMRAVANANVISHFNNLTQANVHEDTVVLLKIARGETLVHPIEARQALLEEIQRDIASAQNTEGIDRALGKTGTSLTVDILLAK